MSEHNVLCPINVKTVEMIRPNFFTGQLMTPGKGYDKKNLLQIVKKKILEIRQLKFFSFIKDKKKIWHEN